MNYYHTQLFGASKAAEVAYFLAKGSIPFGYEPLPDDAHRFVVKEEYKDVLEAETKRRRTPPTKATMAKSHQFGDMILKKGDRIVVLHEFDEEFLIMNLEGTAWVPKGIVEIIGV